MIETYEGRPTISKLLILITSSTTSKRSLMSIPEVGKSSFKWGQNTFENFYLGPVKHKKHKYFRCIYSV